MWIHWKQECKVTGFRKTIVGFHKISLCVVTGGKSILRRIKKLMGNKEEKAACVWRFFRKFGWNVIERSNIKGIYIRMEYVQWHRCRLLGKIIKEQKLRILEKKGLWECDKGCCLEYLCFCHWAERKKRQVSLWGWWCDDKKF